MLTSSSYVWIQQGQPQNEWRRLKVMRSMWIASNTFNSKAPISYCSREICGAGILLILVRLMCCHESFYWNSAEGDCWFWMRQLLRIARDSSLPLIVWGFVPCYTGSNEKNFYCFSRRMKNKFCTREWRLQHEISTANISRQMTLIWELHIFFIDSVY